MAGTVYLQAACECSDCQAGWRSVIPVAVDAQAIPPLECPQCGKMTGLADVDPDALAEMIGRLREGD